jgi:hypothetical protein
VYITASKDGITALIAFPFLLLSTSLSFVAPSALPLLEGKSNSRLAVIVSWILWLEIVEELMPEREVSLMLILMILIHCVPQV